MMSYEEFLEWDGENLHVEWVKGNVVSLPHPGREEADVADFLRAILRPFVEVRGIGIILSEPFQMKTGPNLPGRAPDVLFVAKKNLPRLKENHLQGPADLVIEVISPRTRDVDRGDKFYEYGQGGVTEYWLIDPARRQAKFYVLVATTSITSQQSQRTAYTAAR